LAVYKIRHERRGEFTTNLTENEYMMAGKPKLKPHVFLAQK
jgi:hypothetical protein